jgi:hypothetical protein
MLAFLKTTKQHKYKHLHIYISSYNYCENYSFKHFRSTINNVFI